MQPRQHKFTILEILCVLVLFAAATAIVVRSVNNRGGNGQARLQMKQTLQEVFQQACLNARLSGDTHLVQVSQNNDGEIMLALKLSASGNESDTSATENNGSSVWIIDKEWTLPSLVAMNSLALNPDELRYVFYANGEAKGPTLELKLGEDQTYHLQVDRLNSQLLLRAKND